MSDERADDLVDATPPPVVSVVIPARNAAATLDAELTALVDQEGDVPFEVVVVDDGSTDATREVVDRFRASLPDLRVLDGPQRGPGGARNAGIQGARGELVLCCDADDIVGPRWVVALTAALREADVAGGPMADDLLNAPLQRDARENVFDGQLQRPAGYLEYAATGSFGVRRDVALELDGFDESLRVGGEDVDFSWRAQEAGHSIAFAPEAVVQVRYREGLRAFARQYYGYAIGFAEVYSRRADLGVLRRPSPAAARREAILHLKRISRVDRLLRPETRWRYVRRAAWSAGALMGYRRFRVML